MKGKELKFYHGIFIFIITILLSIFVFSWVQYYLGMMGLAVTEICLLLLAVIPAAVWKQDLKEVFPVRMPKVRELAGTVLIWIASLLLGIIAAQILAICFPGRLENTAEAMSNMFTSVPFFLSFIIVAVLPAICEEALHRGIILHTFKGIGSERGRIVLMGLIFGLFHLSGIRFATTAILGIGLTYVMVRSNNIFLSIFFHFINNSLSVIMTYFAQGQDLAEQGAVVLSPLMAVGSCLILGSGIPLFILFGTMLMNERERRISGRRLTTAVILCLILLAALFIAGFMILMPYAIEVAGNLQ